MMSPGRSSSLMGGSGRPHSAVATRSRPWSAATPQLTSAQQRTVPVAHSAVESGQRRRPHSALAQQLVRCYLSSTPSRWGGTIYSDISDSCLIVLCLSTTFPGQNPLVHQKATHQSSPGSLSNPALTLQEHTLRGLPPSLWHHPSVPLPYHARLEGACRHLTSLAGLR